MDRTEYQNTVADLTAEISRLVTAFCKARGLEFNQAWMAGSYIDFEEVAREALAVGAGVEPDQPASPAGGYKIGRANLGRLVV